MIRVCIVEDNRQTRDALTKILRLSPELLCVGAYGNAEQAEAEMAAAKPDVVLMDINLPKRSGVECVRILKPMYPKVEFVMLTTYNDHELIFEALRAGASGYLLKNMPPTELIQAIEQIHTNGTPMSIQITHKMVSHFQQIKKPQSDMEQLTKREHEILALLAKGYLYKEIADQLGISLSTVRAHLHAVYEKLHVQSRTEAVVKFLERD